METNAVISGIIESALAPFLSEFPPPRTAFDRCEDIMMPARDGICLATRVFYPSGKGPFPVILIRNPYTPVNDNDYMTQGFLLFLLYGYAVVYQNVRGVFDSQGEWLPFENERNDSLDAARWVAAQPFCDGNIATYGGSYLGHVQWSIADLAPPELKTMYISVFGGDPYPLFYENGMFKLGTFTLWATQMMDVRNRTNLAGHDPDSFQKALDTLPHIEADTRLIDHECGWYRQWITNPDARAAYWREGFWGEFAAIAKGARIPVCLQTGWFDIFLPSAIKTFAELPDRTARGSRLLIGPWHHGNAAGGDLTYPDENRHGTFQLRDALDWFDFHLQNKPSAKPAGGITAYAIGEGAWRTFRGGRIRAAGSRRFFLNADEDGLTLRGNPGGRAGAAEYIYDPSDPVRSLGGNLITEYNGGNGLPECSVAQPPPERVVSVISYVYVLPISANVNVLIAENVILLLEPAVAFDPVDTVLGGDTAVPSTSIRSTLNENCPAAIALPFAAFVPAGVHVPEAE